MLRVVTCTLHGHRHHCHCHYQKCRCQTYLLCYLRSNHHQILYHLATCILQQVLKIVLGDACGGGGGSGDGGGGSGVSSLHTEFCVIGAFCFAGFISSSGNCCPLYHKDTSSPSVFLVHPQVQGPISASQRSVQCLYWQHWRFPLRMYCFIILRSGRTDWVDFVFKTS